MSDPSPRLLPCWGSFVAALAAAGYHESGVRQLLALPDVHNLLALHTPFYSDRCRKGDARLGPAVVCWLVHEPAPREVIAGLTGPEGYAWLLERGWLQEVGESQVVSEVDLSPCLGRLFFHDVRFAATRTVVNRVYELGADSYTLARLTPRKPARRALDLCTGSGVHAVLAAGDHEEVVGIDINPRALEFARINAHLNGVGERCSFVQGDLYGPVAGQTFDLITINPPFISTPEAAMEKHRTGGETGEEVSSRAVAGLPTFLRPGGTFSMILTYPVMHRRTYLQRLGSWLRGDPSGQSGDGPVPGWGIAVVNAGETSAEDYISQQISHGSHPNYHQTYIDYLRSYRKHDIARIGFANVFVRRLAEGHPGFAAVLETPFPNGCLSPSVEQYLVALEEVAGDTRAAADDDRVPRWTAGLERLLLSRSRARLEAPEDSLVPALTLEGSLGREIDGWKSVRELAWGREAEPFASQLQQLRTHLFLKLEDARA